MGSPCDPNPEKYVVDKESTGCTPEPLEAGRELSNQWFNPAFYLKSRRTSEGEVTHPNVAAKR